jgi:hypothetical protein
VALPATDDFPAVKDDRLKRMLGYWLAARGTRRMASRNDIDPVELRYILSNVWLCDYEAATRRIRYRLIGENVRDSYAGPVAGRYLDEITDNQAMPRVGGYFLRAVEDPCVVHVGGKIYAERRQSARGERLLLPLSDNDVDGDGLLGATIHFWDNVNPDGTLRFEQQTRTFYPLDGSAPTIEISQ